MKETKNNRLRISFSLLNLWERGDVDGAVATYLHLDRPVTKAMKEGGKFHEDVAKYVEENKKFPEWFFNYELKDPKPEESVVVPYNEMFDLKCIIDLLDEPLMFEYKTGKTDSLGWLRTDQIPFYFLVCELAGIEVDLAFLIRHNQHIKRTDYAVIHNHKGLREHARNVVDSVAPEIYVFFEKEGFLIDK